PLAFFEEVMPPQPASWPARRAGYLRFSDGYAEPAREAAGRGWPVTELPGEHLHMLGSPGEGAAALVSLAAGFGQCPPPPAPQRPQPLTDRLRVLVHKDQA